MHRLADSGRRRAQDERGMALVVALMASMLLTALGLALMVVTNTETMITSNYRTSSEALYAADGGIERAVQDLLLVPDWNRIWNEGLRSSFVDSTNCTGSVPMGSVTYQLSGLTARLQQETNAANLWGANNPVWAPYACGHLSDLLGSGIDSSMYVIAWTADDPSEADGDPLRDTNGVVTIRAEAFGPGGTDKIVEVTVARTSTTEIERGQIAQRGQEELNQRARKAAVQTPGKALTRMSMDTSAGVLR